MIDKFTTTCSVAIANASSDLKPARLARRVNGGNKNKINRDAMSKTCLTSPFHFDRNRAPFGSARVCLSCVARSCWRLVSCFIVLPFLLGGLGWASWKVLQSRTQSCSACGAAGTGANLQCCVCGTPYSSQPGVETPTCFSIPASDLTIDITAQDVDSDS